MQMDYTWKVWIKDRNIKKQQQSACTTIVVHMDKSMALCRSRE